LAGTDEPLTTIVVLTPVKVTVKVFAPDPKTTELVPEPLQSVQVKTPWVVNDVLNAKSPFGRMMKGSASAVIETKRQNSVERSNLRMEIPPSSRGAGLLQGLLSLPTLASSRQHFGLPVVT
jgi:hypothetical protein